MPKQNVKNYKKYSLRPTLHFAKYPIGLDIWPWQISTEFRINQL